MTLSWIQGFKIGNDAGTKEMSFQSDGTRVPIRRHFQTYTNVRRPRDTQIQDLTHKFCMHIEIHFQYLVKFVPAVPKLVSLALPVS